VHRISIISPCLDAGDVVADCLRSAAAQGAGVEHVLVDGAANNGLAGRAAALNPGARILNEPPQGIYAALNAGIAAVRGEIVGILHADDFYPHPGVLKQVVTTFEDPAVGACYGDLCYVDRDDPARVVRYWRAGSFSPARFRHGWMPPHPTFFLRRELYERFGGYRTDLGTAADYELMLRMLLRHGVPTVYIPKVLVHMRVGGASNRSLAARLAANRMDRAAWQVNGLRPLPWTTLAKPLRKVGQWWQRPPAA
jgi:glycosyltransferase